MKTYQIWDKISKINGVEASIILDSRKWAEDEDVILILENNRVAEIQRPSILKSIMNLEGEKTAQEIAEAWLIYQEEENNKEQETQQAEIDKLDEILAGIDAILLA